MLQVTVHGPVTSLRLARTVLGRPLYTVIVYLVDGLLVDSGPPATALELTAWCRSQTVQQVVNTHQHEDHAGGNARLERALNAPVWAPAGAVPILAAAPRIPLYRRLVWGQPRSFRARPLDQFVKTPHYCFQIIPTPGHCPDHICLYEPEQGWLFGGDLFVQERPRYRWEGENLAGMARSLRRVQALQPRVLFCSHAGRIDDPCEAIERKLAYWDEMRQQARSLQAAGLGEREITGRLLGAEGWATRISRGQISKLNLVRALLNHSGEEDD